MREKDERDPRAADFGSRSRSPKDLPLSLSSVDLDALRRLTRHFPFGGFIERSPRRRSGGRRADSARSRTRFRANRSLVSTPIPRSRSRLGSPGLVDTALSIQHKSFAIARSLAFRPVRLPSNAIPRSTPTRNRPIDIHSFECRSRKVLTNENCRREAIAWFFFCNWLLLNLDINFQIRSVNHINSFFIW